MIKNNKGIIVTSIISSILTIAISSSIIFDSFVKENTISQTNTNQEKNDYNSNETVTYTYDNIKGLYTYTSETLTDDCGNEYEIFYNLYLYEDGTFNCRMGTMAPYGYKGNYTIENNIIILNYLFETNSSAEINQVTGSKTITIIDKNTLINNNQRISSIDTTSITLKKDTTTE